MVQNVACACAAGSDIPPCGQLHCMACCTTSTGVSARTSGDHLAFVGSRTACASCQKLVLQCRHLQPVLRLAADFSLYSICRLFPHKGRNKSACLFAFAALFTTASLCLSSSVFSSADIRWHKTRLRDAYAYVCHPTMLSPTCKCTSFCSLAVAVDGGSSRILVKPHPLTTWPAPSRGSLACCCG